MRYKEAIDHILQRLETELSPTLYYHCLDHTKDVLKSVAFLAKQEEVHESDVRILLTAAAYHDCGFLWTYKDHEEKGCEYAREALPGFDFNNNQIEKVCGLIMCTKIPQRAKSTIGKIICDADLDYLGKDDYDRISEDLRKELIENGVAIDNKKWLDIQIGFLEDQKYFTDFSRRERQSKKDEVLDRLKELRYSLYSD